MKKIKLALTLPFLIGSAFFGSLCYAKAPRWNTFHSKLGFSFDYPEGANFACDQPDCDVSDASAVMLEGDKSGIADRAPFIMIVLENLDDPRSLKQISQVEISGKMGNSKILHEGPVKFQNKTAYETVFREDDEIVHRVVRNVVAQYDDIKISFFITEGGAPAQNDKTEKDWKYGEVTSRVLSTFRYMAPKKNAPTK
jgi:hypothetical protein